MAADAGSKPGRGVAHRALSLRGRALALLAQREHSEVELRRKLLRHANAELLVAKAACGGAEPDAPLRDDAGSEEEHHAALDASARIDAVIDWLRAHRYLDDQRFVESRLHARAARYGNLRIRQELAQHGLGLSPTAAQALKATELDRASEVWRRKFGDAPADAAEHARQARFLAQRGFSAEVVSKLLRESRHKGAEDEPDMPAEG